MLVASGRVVWAGEASYEETSELPDVIGRLAGDCTPRPHRARIVLGRDLAQVRLVHPLPPLRRARYNDFATLHSTRLFRRNGVPMVCDAQVVEGDDGRRGLRLAAAETTVLERILEGCAQAGLDIAAIGPAADVMPAALLPGRGGVVVELQEGDSVTVLELSGRTVWRSRLTRSRDAGVASAPSTAVSSADRWVPALQPLGDQAPLFASAYGAAVSSPSLDLLPPHARSARERAVRRQAWRGLLAGVAMWLAAIVWYAVRLETTTRSLEREMARMGAAAESANLAGRELATARTALQALGDAEERRSRHLATLTQLTEALPDSSVLVALTVASDGTVRMAGYGAQAARVASALEDVPLLREVRLEGPVAREPIPGSRGRPLDRFAVVAKLGANR